MLKVGIVGIGNTGNQVASLAQDRLKIPVLAINSSEKDLETVPSSVPKKLISSADGLSQGAGKNRALAKSYLKDSIMSFLSSEDVQTFINDLDVLFIVSSTGGGTGSGTAPLMANIIQSTFVDVKVILIGVLPVNSEALSAHVNTLEYLNELYSQLTNQTYMLYDNDRLASLPSYQMMEKVNEEIVSDIDVIRCTYNMTTRFDSIDEQDMMRLISFPGRIVVARLQKIAEKDLDSVSIEDKLIDVIKKNCHVEAQRDKKVTASGIITNLSSTISETFDNHVPKVREFIGDPIHDFNHIYINEDRKLPNNVFLILSGLTPVNDKIHKISDRVDEIQEKQKALEEENALNEIELSKLSGTVASKDTKSSDNVSAVDLKSIFDKFM
jgi:cell division GTPase FtsZ